MADLSAAEQWAQSNPNHPKSKAVMAKAWAMKNPNDPRSAQIMQKIGSAVQQSANPQQIPDEADKAAQNNSPNAKNISTQPGSPLQQSLKKYLSPGETEDSGLIDRASARVQDPNQWKAFAKGMTGIGSSDNPALPSNQPGYVAPVAGMPPMAVPASGLPGTVAKLASFLNATGSKRVATSTAYGGIKGAIDSPEDRIGGGIKGAGKGLATGLGSELVSGLLNAGGQAVRTIKSALNPAETQNAAQEVIDATSQGLKSSEAENLKAQLGEHNVPIDPMKYQGIHPEIDEKLAKYTNAQTPYGEASKEISVPATEVNDMRRTIDQVSRTNSGNGVVDEVLASKANDLRSKLHGLSPDIDQTYQDWSENLEGAKKMDKARSPISFLASRNPDRLALIDKAGEATGSNLPDIAKQMQLVKPVMQKPLSLGSVSALGKSSIYGAGRSLFGNPESTSIDPRLVEGLSQILQNKTDK